MPPRNDTILRLEEIAAEIRALADEALSLFPGMMRREARTGWHRDIQGASYSLEISTAEMYRAFSANAKEQR
jgi:hypothetical protein